MASTLASARPGIAAARAACRVSLSFGNVRLADVSTPWLKSAETRLQRLAGSPVDGCFCQSMLCVAACLLGWCVWPRNRARLTF